MTSNVISIVNEEVCDSGSETDDNVSVFDKLISADNGYRSVDTPLQDQIDYDKFDRNLEIDSRQLTIFQLLSGHGNFSDVYSGMLSLPVGKIPVAVKMPKTNTESRNRKAWKKQENMIQCQRQLLREELAIMCHLQIQSRGHPNVLKLVGAITRVKSDFCILTEYCELGSMDIYLRNKYKAGEFINEIVSSDHGNKQIWKTQQDSTWGDHFDSRREYGQITTSDLLWFALQIASAMQYLSLKKVLHRDVALRNILLKADFTLKLADFGLSRRLNDGAEAYELLKNKIVLPIRYMAPESLTHGRFTISSECWSLGVVVWELFTFAEMKPYSLEFNRRNNHNRFQNFLLDYLSSGQRLALPDIMPQKLKLLVTALWQEDPQQRPTFQICRKIIGRELNQSCETILMSDQSAIPCSTKTSIFLCEEAIQQEEFRRLCPLLLRLHAQKLTLLSAFAVLLILVAILSSYFSYISTGKSQADLYNMTNGTALPAIAIPNESEHFSAVNRNDDEAYYKGVFENLTWPDGVVPYKFDISLDDYSLEEKTKVAMETIESVSCITFKEKEWNDRFFVRIYRAAGGRCFSPVGRQLRDIYMNAGQPLSLDESCSDKAGILHQLMHAVGFLHEQSRADRDNFVEIVFENIQEHRAYEFEKMSNPDMPELETTYDYRSIMHSRWNDYAIDKTKPTIKIRQNGIDSKILGTGYRLSSTDIVEINRLYECPGYGYDRHINDVKLLVAQQYSIFEYVVFGKFSSRLVINRARRITGVAFDCQKKNFLWREHDSDIGHIIYTARLNATNSDHQKLRTFSEHLYNLVIDWSSRNLYYVTWNKIGVLSLNGKYRKIIIGDKDESIGSPTMTIDQQNSLVIERVDLDGKNRTVFVNIKSTSICGLAVLQERSEICWRSELSQIFCIGLDGHNERVVFNRKTDDGRSICRYCKSLIVLGERFYWSGRQEVHSVSIDGFNYKSFPVDGSGHPCAIAAIPDNCEEVESECALNNGGCQYLCLPKSQGGVSCVCPDNFENLPERCPLDDYGNGVKLLISDSDSVAMYDLSANISRSLVKRKYLRISGVAFDCREQNFLWYENSWRADNSDIIFTARLNGTDSDHKELIKLSGRKLSGHLYNLMIDWSSRNLFCIDSSKNAIVVLSLNGKYQKTIIDLQALDYNRPAMTIDLQNRHVFSAATVSRAESLDSEILIERFDLDGQNRVVLVNGSITKSDFCGLVILHDRSEICWRILNSFSQIYCVGLDGRNERVVFNGTTIANSCSYSSNLIVLGERFYWAGERKVHSVNIDGLDYKFFHPSMDGPKDPDAVFAISDNCEGVESECVLNNGGCPYLCLPKSEGGVSCVCPDNVEKLDGC